MAIELLAVDIDGTMLRSDGTLSPRVAAAMTAAVEAGVAVVPTTGRPMVVSHDVMDATGLMGYWIFANGALTIHRGQNRQVRANRIGVEVALQLVARVRSSQPKARFAIEFDDESGHEEGFADLVFRPPLDPPVDRIEEVLTHDIQKLLVFQLDRDLDDLYRAVTEAVGADGYVSYSGLDFLEVSAETVTKASAVAALAGDLGLGPAEVAAVGDNHNDLPMLQWAGRSFAMGNATEDAKAAADTVVATSDDDGLCDVIEAVLATH